MSASGRSLAGNIGFSRRQVLAAAAALAGSALATTGNTRGQDATPATGWSYTDVVGNTVTLPERPTRIAAAINVAAALWDFGIEVPTIFGWTASNHADGDHVAWGNVDADGVTVVSNTEGNVELEKLLAAKPDLIVTWIWDKDAPAESQEGLPAELAEQIARIAPVVILNRGDANDIELTRVEEIAAALGADLDSPELVVAREAYEARAAEVAQIAADKPDLSVLFGSYGDDLIYIAVPDYVGDAGHLRALGLRIANDGSPNANSYWERLSMEQALLYPSDVLYIDQYGPWTTLEELQQHATIGQHPAVKAGQAGPWKRDLPLSYQGLKTFLETSLEPLRTAQKVT
jgi:iron complex transport system substrate-binding protein